MGLESFSAAAVFSNAEYWFDGEYHGIRRVSDKPVIDEEMLCAAVGLRGDGEGYMYKHIELLPERDKGLTGLSLRGCFAGFEQSISEMWELLERVNAAEPIMAVILGSKLTDFSEAAFENAVKSGYAEKYGFFGRNYPGLDKCMSCGEFWKRKKRLDQLGKYFPEKQNRLTQLK